MAYAGDVVLIYHEEKPVFFARIDSIKPDIKKGWFIVQFLGLTIPLRTFTWILRDEYIDGVPFTMDGKPVKIEAVKPIPLETEEYTSVNKKSKSEPKGSGKKVIPFTKSKKRDKKET